MMPTTQSRWVRPEVDPGQGAPETLTTDERNELARLRLVLATQLLLELANALGFAVARRCARTAGKPHQGGFTPRSEVGLVQPMPTQELAEAASERALPPEPDEASRQACGPVGR